MAKKLTDKHMVAELKGRLDLISDIVQDVPGNNLAQKVRNITELAGVNNETAIAYKSLAEARNSRVELQRKIMKQMEDKANGHFIEW